MSEDANMTMTPDDARYLTFSTLDELWKSGVPIALPVKGEPLCRLQLDPKSGTITLITTYETPEPDVAKLQNVTFNAVAVGDEDLAELTVRVEGSVHGSYSLLATIAYELQTMKLPLAAAVAAGFARHRNMLASRSTLTTEWEIGLFGELLFLEFLIQVVGAGPAVAAWQGAISEEHDFIFDALHVEVKTTVGERRKHVIHGLEQLVPLRGIPLVLLSIQLTRSTPQGGRTLPQLLDNTRTRTGGHQVAVDAMLDSWGWRGDDADLYSTFWALRSEPRAYFVDGNFPAMTPNLIGPVVPNFGLLSDISYRVDITTLRHDSLPEPLGGFVESRNRLVR